MLRIALVILAAIVVTAAWPSAPKHDFQDDLREIRALTARMIPGIEGAPPLEKAIALRNFLHWKVPVKALRTDWSNLSAAYRDAVTNPASGHICGGLVILYIAALQSFGIEARKVSMYRSVTKSPDPVWSHASAEVRIDGTWIAMDPTFNFSLKTGWASAWQKLSKGESIMTSLDGHKIRQRYKSLNITAPLGSKHNALTPFAAHMNILKTTFPASWDGVVRYASGKTFDSARDDTQEFYRALYSGSLK